MEMKVCPKCKKMWDVKTESCSLLCRYVFKGDEPGAAKTVELETQQEKVDIADIER